MSNFSFDAMKILLYTLGDYLSKNRALMSTIQEVLKIVTNKSGKELCISTEFIIKLKVFHSGEKR
jgi:hypothetical protein